MNVCRGSLYVAPTDDGPYDPITGGEAQIRNIIQTGPIFVQLYDWNHYPTEHLIEEWEKACVSNLSSGNNIYTAIAISNRCAKMSSLTTEWVR